MSILVVDDSEDTRVVMEAMLRKSGCEDIATADCAEEAYGLLGLSPCGAEGAQNPGADQVGSRVELILMDIGMPTTDGLEACRCIKGHARLRAVPVIFVTGQTDAASVRAAFSAGAAALVAKPVCRADLVASMREALGSDCWGRIAHPGSTPGGPG